VTGRITCRWHTLATYEYTLPEHAIAQVPVEPRDAARLLVDGGRGRPPGHRHVRDLPELVRPGDVIVVNVTKVLPARLTLRKPTGGSVEVLLVERGSDGWWTALVRPSRRTRPGTSLVAGPDLTIEVAGVLEDGQRRVRLHLASPASGTREEELAALERHGAVPLPPYITQPLADPGRYQTVYATAPGSAAAPTAGLHLTDAVLGKCRAAGATIHEIELDVGLATFRPITAERVDDHTMHAERYRVPAETMDACAAAARVLAVGTTTVRALEAAGMSGALAGRTDLFIRPGFEFRIVDALLTNFHLPRSTLLVLLEAFMGPRWRELYDVALEAGYRFLSFGDAMLVERAA
jgi:S-adenosylmethionine:tRNA ribosyltransferase-isomerase